MLAYTYVEKGKFKLLDKPVPKLSDARDAIVRVTMSSICSSDLISSTVLYPGQFRELQWAMRWWESWKKQEKM